MSKVTTIGLDLAKSVFQVHGVNEAEPIVLRKRLRRGQVLTFFASLPPCLIGMEACATAHSWARELTAFGHEVRLMPPQYVKAYVKRNKNDAADAEAICEAVRRPSMRSVPVKTVEQQAALMMHRTRELLVLAWHKANLVSQRLATIPGIGPIIATAIAATVANPKEFRSGREFAAWLGLVPRQNSTGGKARLGGISKRGDSYLRRLLVNGAHAVLLRSKAAKDNAWLTQLRERKHRLVVAVALANKTARIAWAIMSGTEPYRPAAAAA